MTDLGDDGGIGAGGAAADAFWGPVRELLQDLLKRPGFGFSDAELLANLRAAYEVCAVAEAVKLFFVEAARIRPGLLPGLPAPGPGVEPGRDARRFLMEALRVSPKVADRDLAAARAIHSGEAALPVMGAALAEGMVSRAHLDVAVSAVEGLPTRLTGKVIVDAVLEEDGSRSDATGAELVDQLLTQEALAGPPESVVDTGRRLRAALDPDPEEKFNPEAYERRSVTFSTDFNGNTLVRGAFDAATGVQLQGAIARRAAKRFPAGTAVDADGTVRSIRDRRSTGQRAADALRDLVLAGALALGEPDPTVTPTGIVDVVDDGSLGDAVGETAGAGEAPAAAQPGLFPEPAGHPSDHPGDHADDHPGDRSAGGSAGEAFRRPVESGRRVLEGGMWQAGCPVDISLITSLDQLIAAHTGDRDQRAAAGLAHTALAGNTGARPGATVSPWVLAYLTCDNPIRRIILDPHGAVLDQGHAHRLATLAQRRALTARDGGCVIPGCHAPPPWCDIHHLIPWEHGGPTDLDNLLLLCRAHHTAHHAGTYHIKIEDGVPWVRMPAWVDFHRPWLRNTTHDRHRRVHQLTARLVQPDTH